MNRVLDVIFEFSSIWRINCNKNRCATLNSGLSFPGILGNSVDLCFENVFTKYCNLAVTITNGVLDLFSSHIQYVI